MQEPGKSEKRIDVPYFEGVNAIMGHTLAKKTEFVHAENARSKTIGTVEKREGQTVLGTSQGGAPFVTSNNYGLFPFTNETPQGFFRVSVNGTSTLAINVYDYVNTSDQPNATKTPLTYPLIPLTIFTAENISITDNVNGLPGDLATIYYLNSLNEWIPLSQYGTNIAGGQFDYTFAEGNVFLANFNDLNRYIKPDGVTVVTSNDGSGHLFNTPPASRVNFYKNRLYLADFVRSGVRYKTTILQSSYPMGIISLLNGDVTSNDIVNNTWTLPLTDTKYIYNDVGANQYEIYRGPNKIAEITVTSVQETGVTVASTDVDFFGTYDSFLSADEMWIKGTYTGAKVFRWVNNPTIQGKDVKQYDTMKLSGGENNAITMLTNVGNVMMISNGSAMASWNDYTLENFDLDIGCVSKKGYVKNLGTLYFLHYTGIYATSGGVPQLISTKIQPYIDGATKSGKESSAAGKKGRSIFFTLGDVTLYNPDGSIENELSDVCVEYNLVQENWFIHTNVKASEFATFIEETNSDRLEFTDKEGNKAVKEFLSGETDDGKEIPFRVDFMDFTMQSDFENQNVLNSVVFEAQRGASMQTFVKLDENDIYYPIPGQVVKGLSIVKVTGKDSNRTEPPTTRMVSISLRDSSKQLCKISRMSIIFLPTPADQGDNDAD